MDDCENKTCGTCEHMAVENNEMVMAGRAVDPSRERHYAK